MLSIPAPFVLKQGLDKLKNSVEVQRKAIPGQLAEKERASLVDLEWLDTAGNVVKEEQLVWMLDEALDYKQGVGRLDENQKELLTKLADLAVNAKAGAEKVLGHVEKTVTNKRKCPTERKVLDKPTQSTAKVCKPAPVFTHKENATLWQKIEILDWHWKQPLTGKQKKPNQGTTAAHFDKQYPNLKIKQPLILAWIKGETELRWQWDEVQAKGRLADVKHVKQTENPEVDAMLKLWIMQAMQDSVQLNGAIICKKWTRFADQMGILDDKRLKLSEQWLDSLKKQMGLKEFRCHGEAALANPNAIWTDHERIQDLIVHKGYALEDVFNMDKMDSSSAYHWQRKQTAHQLGFLYQNNVKAWITTVLYQEWLWNWDADLVQQNHWVLLLQDNFSGHTPPEDISNIHVENFTANLTAHVQPMDAGIIQAFKAHYRCGFMQRSLDHYDSNISLAHIYNINQLEAMRLADQAWRKISQTTIANCWIKSGILPDKSTEVRMAAELALEAEEEKACEKLLEVLDAAELINVANEMSIHDGCTEEEIYNAVMDVAKASQDQEANGGDDNDCNVILPRPSRNKALQAVQVLQQYLEVMNSSFSRDLKHSLAKLGCKTQLECTMSLKGTALTNYFTCK
ncbi:unnamed protein product [Mycena citricolor]|uniref:HTH CENPB-type domain-containing protein n=1 Tax=Mycena citricolor TaxID=2018698 RepID=A0AAD2HK79_9AGAR|nr:unnamed protein product [Mycena citricolor]